MESEIYPLDKKNRKMTKKLREEQKSGILTTVWL